jgi:hypothetical protein
MPLTHILGSDTLLTYSLATSPSPVQVSPTSGPPSIASLTFIVSCPPSVGSATVSQIVFNLPIGNPNAPDASDLTESAAGISPSVTSSGSDKWQIGPGASAGSFVLTPAPKEPGIIESQGLTVTLNGIQVGPIVGNAVVTIVEMAAASGAPRTPRQCNVGVPKFPYGFFVGDFAANLPMVQDGDPVLLTWSGSSQAKYTMLWADQSLDVSKVHAWPSPELHNTTTFILEVTAQEAGQSVTLRFSTTVIVANPDLVATSLQVRQKTTLQGATTIGADSAPADLSVAGTATLKSATAGALSVSGASNLSNVTVSGPLGALGAVAILGAGQAIPVANLAGATYANDTDGILVGYVGQDRDDVSIECWGRITVTTGPFVFRATGGDFAVVTQTPPYMIQGANGNTLTAPVPKGVGFSIGCEYWGMQKPTVTFVWYPLGTGPDARKGLRKLSERPLAKLKSAAKLRAAKAPEQTAQVAAVVSALNRALKRTVSSADQARIGKALLQLVDRRPTAKRPRR